MPAGIKEYILLYFSIRKSGIMGKTSKDLLKFLQPFPPNVQQTTLWLRDFVWKLYPDSNELIYDNYNALAIGFSLSDTAGDAFCSIAVFSKHVNFGFNRGSEIDDPEKILTGNGSLYRYIKVSDTKDFPVKVIKKLLEAACVNALARSKKNKQVLKGETIVKMVATKKRRPA